MHAISMTCTRAVGADDARARPKVCGFVNVSTNASIFFKAIFLAPLMFLLFEAPSDEGPTSATSSILFHQHFSTVQTAVKHKSSHKISIFSLLCFLSSIFLSQYHGHLFLCKIVGWSFQISPYCFLQESMFAWVWVQSKLPPWKRGRDRSKGIERNTY